MFFDNLKFITVNTVRSACFNGKFFKVAVIKTAFKKIKNVITVVAQKKKLVVNLPLDPATVIFEEGFSRDVSGLGHWGCGAVELHLQNNADLEKAKALIDRAYNEN